MRVFEVRNAQEALPQVLSAVLTEGVERDSRNGPVVMFPTPITIQYQKPTERVIFWSQRDANPFFHCFEAMWMLNGNNDVEFPAYFAKQILKYSDDGFTLAGAYGYRWRKVFGRDQIEIVIDGLHKNKDCRRQVIQMWDTRLDLGSTGRDLCCNLTATVQINTDGELDLTVFQRSGDILWGILGSNTVHFSFLQEYIACSIGVPVGKYYQVTVNAHVYNNEMLAKCKSIASGNQQDVLDSLYHRISKTPNPYEAKVILYPLFIYQSRKKEWDEDLKNFFDYGLSCNYKTTFFNHVVLPMFKSHHTYKTITGPEKYNIAIQQTDSISASDWRRACREWLERRRDRFNERLLSATEAV